MFVLTWRVVSTAGGLDRVQGRVLVGQPLASVAAQGRGQGRPRPARGQGREVGVSPVSARPRVGLAALTLSLFLLGVLFLSSFSSCIQASNL